MATNHDGICSNCYFVTHWNYRYFHTSFYSGRWNLNTDFAHHYFRIMVDIRLTVGGCFSNALIKKHVYYYIRNLFNILIIAFLYNFSFVITCIWCILKHYSEEWFIAFIRLKNPWHTKKFRCLWWRIRKAGAWNGKWSILAWVIKLLM